MKAIFKQLTGPIIFMFAGLLFFAIGSGMTMHQRTLEKQGIEAPGVVIDLQEHSDSEGSTYSPVVQFKTNNGQSVEIVSSYSSSPPEHEIGESVIVVYPPDKPENAIIKGDGQLLHIIFMLLGGLFAVIGFYLVFSIVRAAANIHPGE